jgi:gluconate 2-dehydrogenase gamma chain
LLASAAVYVAGSVASQARIISGAMPWVPSQANPPQPWRPGPWLFFTADEAATIEAVVDRLIPPDERSAGGKDAGCAVFIDRQLAGPYGEAAGLYMRPPFLPGTVTQGNQSPDAPAMNYRTGLSALADYIRSNFAGKSFASLSPQDQDSVLSGLEQGAIDLKRIKSAEFFNLLLQNTQEGYFADPIYGGNRDMAGWKLVGFPGARYDYRDWVERHNEPYPLPPVAIAGRSDWTARE